METSTTCPTCHGPRNVAFKREMRKVEGTELTELTMIPQADSDAKWLVEVFPRTGIPRGYELTYEYSTTKISNEKGDVHCLRVFLKKVGAEAGEPATAGGVDLRQKSIPELVEMAVMAGATDAKKEWGKAKLIEAIEAKKLVGAGA